MSVLIKNMEMPKGCIYANDNDQTEYCPLLNHDDVPFCQYIETEPEIAIGIDERPVYCPLFDVPESCQDTVSRAAAIDALDEIESEIANGYGYQYPKWRKYFCELPSAQPEVIRCKDCKHYKFADNRAFGFPVKRCEWTGFEDVDNDDFCSRAEREVAK